MKRGLNGLRWSGLCIFLTVFFGSFIFPYIQYGEALSSIMGGMYRTVGVSLFGFFGKSPANDSGVAAVGTAMIILVFLACALLCASSAGSIMDPAQGRYAFAAAALGALSVIIHIILYFLLERLINGPARQIGGDVIGIGLGYGYYFNLIFLITGTILSASLAAASIKTARAQVSPGGVSAELAEAQLRQEPALAPLQGQGQGQGQGPGQGPGPGPGPGPGQAPVATIEPATGREPGGVVIGKSGMYKYAAFRIKSGEELIIGRDAAQAHIIVDTDAEKVSRKHCSIIYDGNALQYFVTDYSSNGTYTDDGARLRYLAMTKLPCGITVFLGNSKNSFLLN